MENYDKNELNNDSKSGKATAKLTRTNSPYRSELTL